MHSGLWSAFSDSIENYQNDAQYLNVKCATFPTSRKSAIKLCRVDVTFMQEECALISAAVALYYLIKKNNLKY